MSERDCRGEASDEIVPCVKTLIDFDNAAVVALPVTPGHSEPGPRECVLLEGPQGWGEFSPPADADDDVRWLTAAVEPGTVGWPDAVRGRVPVAVQVPAVDPARAHELVRMSGCRTAEVSAGGDTVARLEAVRDALRPGGRIRVVVAHAGDAETDLRCWGELEFVELPAAIAAEVRRRIDVPVAVEVGRVGTAEADVAVLSSASSGGVRRALRIVETVGVPCVVRAGRASSVGLAGEVALAGALPELPYACAVSRPAWVTDDVAAASRALIPVDGYVPVAPMPPAPQPELLDRWALTDHQAVQRWRARLSRAQEAL